MNYVNKDSGEIYSLISMYRYLKIARATPPTHEELKAWNFSEVTEKSNPIGDVVKPTNTASENEDGKWYRNYDVRSYTDEERIKKAKQDREIAVKSIIITTASNKSFDGNEEAQNRMARAIVGMNAEDSINWVLADNTIASVSKAELQEALYLAGQEQAALWVVPYEIVSS